jgi:hypothetical protein
MLNDRADIPDAERSLLPFLGLLQDVSDNESQTARRIQADSKWLCGEKLLHLLDPERLDCVEIHIPVGMEPIQQRHIFAHISDAATARSTTLRRQNSLNPIPMQDRLDRAFAESKNLSASFSQKLLSVEW